MRSMTIKNQSWPVEDESAGAQKWDSETDPVEAAIIVYIYARI
ncbi:MAG TPA: hypothetical protein VF070_26530 [Streptosporangiaceae bacterium]|jgi:hypothetical protein